MIKIVRFVLTLDQFKILWASRQLPELKALCEWSRFQPEHRSAPMAAESPTAIELRACFARYGFGVEQDVTAEYHLYATNAPPAYDGFGTLRLASAVNVPGVAQALEAVGIVKEHLDWQVGRYQSGWKTALPLPG